MSRLKTQIEEYYNEYKKFEVLTESAVEKSKTAKNNLKDLSEESINEATNTMVDSLLIASQSRVMFETLMNYIKLYLEVAEEELTEEIKTFYEKSKPFKTKSLFAIEKDQLIPTDEKLLEEARNQVKSRINIQAPQ